jgi:D-glycero-D-manno-heptose 1,7-bisphosphate phosphatase
MKRPAVFLDRDGVINKNIFYESSGEWESPRKVCDVALHEKAAHAITRLNRADLPVFIVSNQPSYAKGKVSMDDLFAVQKKILQLLEQENATICESYYSYEHPQSIVADIPGPRQSRKPSPYFLQKAAADYKLDLQSSWMVGDRDSDIECGINARTRTIAVAPDHPNAKAGRIKADYDTNSLEEAVSIILRNL